jgi:hypothetical protein
MKVKNSLNAHTFAKNYETNHEPSKTIPDQSMSLRTLLQRHAMGMPLSTRVPIYEGDDSDPIDPRRLDISERHELAELYRQELKEIQERLPKKKQAKPKTGEVSEASTSEPTDTTSENNK